MNLTIGSLFSGIGGIELGLGWAGHGPVIWQVEKSEYCRTVLAKHWPQATRYPDVTTARNLPYVDLICGGFPCQNLSSAGKGEGLAGKQSGLWFEFERIVGECRPRFVVVENVASGINMWLPTVRRGLHVLGYRSAAYRLSAADVGAPHLRKRIFVVAANADHKGQPRERGPGDGGGGRDIDRAAPYRRDWAAEPDVDRVGYGIPEGVDRNVALANAVVPQCLHVIGLIVKRIDEGERLI